MRASFRFGRRSPSSCATTAALVRSRPPSGLPRNAMLIGIDWGGTKIEAMALAPDGRVLDRRRVATPQGDYPGCIGEAAGLVLAVEAELGQTGTVGVGIPGTISPRRGLVIHAK